jgi:ABC-2 type transport system ATP-binding protein
LASRGLEPEGIKDEFAIQTFGLTKKFNSRVAVDDLELNIKKGELFALLGPNGAGKTTTVNMLCCLLKPTSGAATVLDYDVNRQPFKVKKVIGVAPQETVISERLNPRENLNLIGKLHGVKSGEIKIRSQRLLETMGLSDRAEDRVKDFSGGMKRRLNIMMALIHDPEILFLDEPTLGLDPQARRAVWEYIVQLKGQKTILLNTNYMDEADFLADRIGIIDGGKIVALGSSAEIKVSILQRQTMIVNARNLTQKVIGEMRSRYEEVDVTDDIMVVTDKQIEFKQIVDLLHSSGAIIRSAYLKEPTLEDVFLHITGRGLRE